MIKEIFKIKKNDVITVVGCGGKTTFINKAAKELLPNKVLLSTTTKILKEEFLEYDYIVVGEEINTFDFSKKGCYLAYDYELKGLKKLVGFKKENLEKITNNFYVSLIEGDGSRRKKLKGWKDYEPVVLDNSTKTIGIINLKLLGKPANDTNVHNLEEFLTISNLEKNAIMLEENLIQMICHKNGIFKNCVGEKILFINQLDTYDELTFGETFSKKILEKINIKIIIGSLNNQFYKEVRR